MNHIDLTWPPGTQRRADRHAFSWARWPAWL